MHNNKLFTKLSHRNIPSDSIACFIYSEKVTAQSKQRAFIYKRERLCLAQESSREPVGYSDAEGSAPPEQPGSEPPRSASHLWPSVSLGTKGGKTG